VNLSESLRELSKKINDINTITEAKGHLDHPEDLVFLGGSNGATNAVNAIVNTVKNPKTITIKWDGYPALIFGRGPDGRFSIMDKHMFNKKDGSGRAIYSPEQFRQYDLDRGVDRSQLHQLISEIWTGLEKSDRSKGYYWGDLLFSQPLKPAKDGLYHFKANPNGIAYTVDPKSEIGQMLTGKQAAIVVHQFIPAGAMTTDEATPLNGTIGNLKNNSNVAIVPAKMPITPKLNIDSALVKNAQSAISKYRKAVDQLMSTAPQSASAFQTLFTTYINKKIVSKNLNDLVKGFYEYFQSRPMTDSMRNKLTQHLEQNKQGVIGAFTIWSALYQLKMAVVNQLNKAAESAPVQGYLQDGTRTQEGFVSQGLKFVDRMGFSAQNLAGQR
jgi:Family of unknown function (DUF6267)